MKTSKIKLALIFGMIATSSVALASGYGHYSPVSTATETTSIAGTQAGVNFGTNAGGMSFTTSSAWNQNSASAGISRPRYGSSISSGSEAQSKSGAAGFNVSFGRGSFGNGFAIGEGFAGATGSSGSIGNDD